MLLRKFLLVLGAVENFEKERENITNDGETVILKTENTEKRI